MNNVAQHFVTAFLDLHLKGEAAKAEYLDLVEVAEEGVWSVAEDGAPNPDHSYWRGFPERTAIGAADGEADRRVRRPDRSDRPGASQPRSILKDIRRAARRQFSAEEKIRIVLEGLRGEDSIAELCRREGIASSMYYGWSKEFLEAGKRRLAGDTRRAKRLRRGEGPAPRGRRAQGGRGRPHAGEPPAQKSMSGAGGDDA
jgi:transposase